MLRPSLIPSLKVRGLIVSSSDSSSLSYFRRKAIKIALNYQSVASNAPKRHSPIHITSSFRNPIKAWAFQKGQEQNSEIGNDDDVKEDPRSDHDYPNSARRDFTLIAFASSDRTGTGVAASLVSSQERAGQGIGTVPKDGSKDYIAVYFQQHRSLYEKEYTAVIVALEWLLHHYSNETKMIVTMCLRDDIVYNQLMGIYPIQKDSLQRLHRKASNLIGACPFQIRFELSTSASLYEECKDHANRVLLMEKSDKNVFRPRDPLMRSKIPIEEEEIQLETPIDQFVTSSTGETKRTLETPPKYTEENIMLEEYMFDSPDIETDENLLDEVNNNKWTGSTSNQNTISSFDTETGAEEVVVESKHAAGVLRDSQDTLNPLVHIDPQQTYLLQFDGGSRGNPGTAACGMVICDSESNVVWKGGKFLGDAMTCNQAEYNGVLLGLRHAKALGIRKLRCEGDSNLIIQQLKGKFKVKNEGLKPLYKLSSDAMAEFDEFELAHVFREKNKVADHLANLAMDERLSFGLMIDT